MTLTEQLLGELDREAARTKRVLEQVPASRDDWKPHEKSMALGRLAGMIATMPSWVTFIVKQDELDLTPPGGGEWKLPAQKELVAAHDKSLADARAALQATSDPVLLTTNWKLRAGGQVVSDVPRHIALRDMLNHLAHHRGQLTVYLRLLGAKVPAVYGPSADDQQFA
ncbi:MAG TPA: DinB family protein [Vicinamibacterales bacterium]|nr:DinB family protein [Vicinamibacterales bacterium]